MSEDLSATDLSGSQTHHNKKTPKMLTTGALYHELTHGEEKKLSYASFNNHILRLESLQLIDTHKQSLPTQGRVTEIMLRYETGDVKEACRKELAG